MSKDTRTLEEIRASRRKKFAEWQNFVKQQELNKQKQEAEREARRAERLKAENTKTVKKAVKNKTVKTGNGKRTVVKKQADGAEQMTALGEKLFKKSLNDENAFKAKTPEQLSGTDKFKGKYTDVIRNAGYDYDNTQASERPVEVRKQSDVLVLKRPTEASKQNSQTETSKQPEVPSYMKGFSENLKEKLALYDELEQLDKKSKSEVQSQKKAYVKNMTESSAPMIGKLKPATSAKNIEENMKLLYSEGGLRKAVGDEIVDGALKSGMSAGDLRDKLVVAMFYGADKNAAKEYVAQSRKHSGRALAAGVVAGLGGLAAGGAVGMSVPATKSAALGYTFSQALEGLKGVAPDTVNAVGQGVDKVKNATGRIANKAKNTVEGLQEDTQSAMDNFTGTLRPEQYTGGTNNFLGGGLNNQTMDALNGLARNSKLYKDAMSLGKDGAVAKDIMEWCSKYYGLGQDYVTRSGGVYPAWMTKLSDVTMGLMNGGQLASAEQIANAASGAGLP